MFGNTNVWDGRDAIQLHYLKNTTILLILKLSLTVSNTVSAFAVIVFYNDADFRDNC